MNHKIEVLAILVGIAMLVLGIVLIVESVACADELDMFRVTQDIYAPASPTPSEPKITIQRDTKTGHIIMFDHNRTATDLNVVSAKLRFIDDPYIQNMLKLFALLNQILPAAKAEEIYQPE